MHQFVWGTFPENTRSRDANSKDNNKRENNTSNLNPNTQASYRLCHGVITEY